MAQILKFIYAFIILLSLFFVVTNSSSFTRCRNDVECPQYSCLRGLKMKCICFKCMCV
ncbi:Nodule Cysteine-Rich (NCR) secreted peptide [Medicago truncatula]|uniref:Nodule Cysteine-Rich (NCR) secreted peptide n=2 Tax=Medicago truncatula TaxID=3880 RepID=A0A072UVS0_MEDTR|nr:Nodule Cysteine-Rich (NCR) secreted peptide [Medicago truncatula]